MTSFPLKGIVPPLVPPLDRIAPHLDQVRTLDDRGGSKCPDASCMQRKSVSVWEG